MLKAHLHNCVKLNNRILWFDGDSTVDAEDIINNITNGNIVDSLFVESLTDEIIQYNKLVPKAEKFSVKTNIKDLSFEWNIPEEYKKLDVITYVGDMLLKREGSAADIDLRARRIADELTLYRKLELFDTLRTLIYIVSILEKEHIVWGVGRGSSVASYVLYIIGIHDVDSYHYNLNIEEFLRNPTS